MVAQCTRVGGAVGGEPGRVEVGEQPAGGGGLTVGGVHPGQHVAPVDLRGLLGHRLPRADQFPGAALQGADDKQLAQVHPGDRGAGQVLADLAGGAGAQCAARVSAVVGSAPNAARALSTSESSSSTSTSTWSDSSNRYRRPG